MKNLKLSKETKNLLKDGVCFIVVFFACLLIASTLFNK